ncbi:hypothetical protein HII12_004044 [Brettanomyces bruxellensis]|uniref:Ubiquitin-activating enzyme E1-like n=1 Tax=Dekkera bruxellensis TaxID=5007 RepID=A0A8H6BC10_DEKBR|nr:hypothetical protein HII12_004044 [Brettanomyces bruxellensis]
MAIDSYMQKMFGETNVSAFRDATVLLVGAGGIGCELLKDLIMMQFGEIHVLDLDTIDLSNLNRQFLFRQKDIKTSKALTAVKAVKSFNHFSKLVAHHGNIMDKAQFPLSFFEQFDMIFNALDNLEARMYVNKICLFTRVPLMESGTTGLKGQVQPIYPYLTECFACVPKTTPKAFPVCTIRSTPSKPVHCVTWAKNYLFPQLFGPRDFETQNVPTANQDEKSEEDNAKEKAEALRETNELLDLKNKIDYAAEKLQNSEVYGEVEKKPTPLDYEGQYKHHLDQFLEKLPTDNLSVSDQKLWTPLENLKVFARATLNLTRRLAKEKIIDFDKDDQDALDFVATASNLRSVIFDIPRKTEFEVKQIAGNIIPAVATTNAIMAGFSGLSSIHYFLSGKNTEEAVKHSRMICDSSSRERFVNSSTLFKPNPKCKQCSITRGIAKVDLSTIDVGAFRDAIVSKYNYEDDISLTTSDSRLLYDFDFDDNRKSKLSKFVTNGDILLVTDSEEKLDLVELMLVDTSGKSLVLPDLEIPEYQGNEQESETEDNSDSNSVIEQEGDDDDIVVLDKDEDEKQISKKRKLEDDSSNEKSVKSRKVEHGESKPDDDMVVLD